MNSHPQPRLTAAAFTLIELLTVITIIAILMGLLFPAINIAKDQANKAKAKAAVTGIAAAVKQYYTEYGKYPIGASTITGDVTFGDKAANTNQLLFDILTNYPDQGSGKPNTYNPRGIPYFEGKQASDPGAPRDGFTPTGASGSYTVRSFLDPWGTEYRVVLDNDYDNQITTLPYTDFGAATTGPRTGVAVYSLGKDKSLGKTSSTPGSGPYGGSNGDNYFRNPTTNTNSDDVISWQ